MPTSRRPDPTGGQWNFAGVLYQLLVSLRAGLSAVIDEVAEREAATSARLIVEPDQGGDAQTLTRGRRRVDQIKIRRGSKPWTTHIIAETVLSDLFKAHALSGPPTEYRFVTYNLDGTDALAGFLNACRALADQGRRSDGLDATAKRFRWGPAHITSAGLFDHLVATLAPHEAERVWGFLCSVRIVGISQTVATAEINTILGILVDAPQEIAVRRRALGQALLELGAARNAIDGAALLRSAGLAPERLTHAACRIGFGPTWSGNFRDSATTVCTTCARNRSCQRPGSVSFPGIRVRARPGGSARRPRPSPKPGGASSCFRPLATSPISNDSS